MGNYRKSKVWDYSKEYLQDVVNDCNSISDVLQKLGYSRASGTMSKFIKSVLKEKEIDTSHFRPFRRTHQAPTYSMDDILVKDSSYSNIYSLKRRLISGGYLEYKCQICGNFGEWNGKELVLQLDHINGDHFDHRLENLRFLCPNCHSQTDTFSGKNINHN